MVLRFFILAVFLLMSCADGERDNPYDPGSENYVPWGSSSSVAASSSSPSGQSSSTAKEYDYCVYDKFCAEGPFTKCQGDGVLSNSCPYGSSSSLRSSSSSKPSSSSSVPSSSSKPSSSSSAPPSSSSAPPSSSSAVPSSSSVPIQSGVVYGTPVTYEGETYKTVVIGTQTWFQRNLNYAVSGSKCGNGSSLSDANTSTCNAYGRLYNWATAMALDASCNSTSCSGQIKTKHQGICPDGWHIPSDDDWDKLMTAVGGASTAGRYLKATSGWYDYNGQSGNGEDKYGFSALPGGFGLSDGSFSDVGYYGSWWSSTEGNAYFAYYRYMDYGSEGVGYGLSSKDLLLCVRCLQD